LQIYKKGAAKNVALTYHIKGNHKDSDLKYSFSTPVKVYASLQQKITAGCPSPKFIPEDVNWIWKETLG
jgi:hypothetical protein